MRCTLLWFRNDLRLDDNPALQRALGDEVYRESHTLVPCFVLDPKFFRPLELGFRKAGARRARFLLQGLDDLRRDLRQRGSDLLVRVGDPSEVLSELARATGADEVVFARGYASEEQSDEARVTHALDRLNVRATGVHSTTLYHPDDLPFSPEETPRVFTNFRKKLEKHSQIRAPFDPPERLPTLPADVAPGDLPTLAQLGFDEPAFDDRSVLAFEGGARAARARLADYVWEGDHLKTYKYTRNGLIGANYSSKFSPWLAQGSLSPRRIAAEVRRYEQERKKNSSTYWMIFELIWRDFFQYIAMKHGRNIFLKGGLDNRERPWRRDLAHFELWCSGSTGNPFVDANMRELRATGFMSNRGRQNVASYLAKYLEIDWRWGAAWFEHHLLDYDPYSNWGNWLYVAGVGNDPRDRIFNVRTQADKYDKKGEYVKLWCPELAPLPPDLVHAPEAMSDRRQSELGVRLGVDYPLPLVDVETHVKRYYARH